MKSILMQRDILLKVWLFLSRPAARAKEKQRAQSPLRCRWTTTLRGTLNLRWQNQHQRKAHVEREREERFQNKKKSEMKYDAKRPSLSPDSPLYSPREREIQKAPPPSSTNQSHERKKKTKKNKRIRYPKHERAEKRAAFFFVACGGSFFFLSNFLHFLLCLYIITVSFVLDIIDETKTRRK